MECHPVAAVRDAHDLDNVNARPFAPQEGPRIIAAESSNGFRVPVLLWSLLHGDPRLEPPHP
jgi:hypothetical protein